MKQPILILSILSFEEMKIATQGPTEETKGSE
jgi:hypothetical protein